MSDRSYSLAPWPYRRRPYSLVWYLVLYSAASNGLAVVCSLAVAAVSLLPRFAPWPYPNLTEARVATLSGLVAWAAAGVLAVSAVYTAALVAMALRRRNGGGERAGMSSALEVAVAIPSLAGVFGVSLFLNFLVADVKPDWHIPDSVNVFPVLLLLGALTIHGLYVSAMMVRHARTGVWRRGNGKGSQDRS